MNFNRKLLYRGSCVSERCPSSEINSTWRFERCIQQQTQALRLTATLREYHCHSDTSTPLPLDFYQRTFLVVVAIVLCFNLLGTIYDFATGNNGERKLLLAWSIRSNWRSLFASHKDGDSRLLVLAPLHGLKTFLMFFVMMVHVINISYNLYLYNPNFFEKTFDNPFYAILRNGFGIVQVFIVIGNFLFGYILLIHAKNMSIRLSKFPAFIINRIFRLAPVHILVVWFAATWWEQFGSGPQWASIVGAEATLCRRKLPLHVFFVHNLVQPADNCLPPTWFIAVDFQLNVIASFVMLALMQFKWRPLPILIALFLLSFVVNVFLIHFHQWKSILYILKPEKIMSTFRDETSFNQFYISPWGSLPSAFMGLLAAQLHFQMQETGYKITNCKLFVFLYQMAPLLLFLILMSGNILEKYTLPTFTTAYTAIERPIFGLLAILFLLGSANNIDNIFRRILSWHGFIVMGRMSLPVLTIHWCVIKALVATRRTLTDASFFHLMSDLFGSWFWTYMLAFPVTILVEYPGIKMAKALLTRFN